MKWNKTSNKFIFSPEKLDKDGPAYQKWKNSKRFDPARSEVMRVLDQQKDGNFSVDKAAIHEIYMYEEEMKKNEERSFNS